MRLYLVRHGQTAWNIQGLAQGHTDEPLDEIGTWQAEQMRDGWIGHRCSRVLSSDLSRARMTAETLALAWGAELELTPILRERCFGDWEGMPYTTLRAEISKLCQRTGHDEQQMCPPGGESAHDVWNRLTPLVERLQSETEDLAVVSHGGTTGLLLARLMRGTVDTARSLHFGNTSVNELRRRSNGYWALERYNDCSHLGRPSAPMIDANTSPVA